MILVTSNLRLLLQPSLRHLFPQRPTHGPQVWPWWRAASFSIVSLEGFDRDGKLGWIPRARRLWVYSRWGAVYIDVMWRTRRGQYA